MARIFCVMNFINWGLIGLFSGTFLSATLLPFPSEALVIAFNNLNYSFWTVLFTASLGNFIGGLTNYFIGYKSNVTLLKKRFQLNENRIIRWERRLAKWGMWLGLLSWIPIIGDPMVAVMGFYKVKLLPFALMMLIGKFFRYYIILSLL